MTTARYFLAAVAALLVSTSTLFAQEYKTAITISISPLHLYHHIVEVTGEFAMTRDVGVAGIAGIGTYEGVTIFEIGGQYNYYLIGNFDYGMQIGGELMYLYVSDEYNDDNSKVRIRGIGKGLAISPFFGYKVAADFGLTLNLQAGASLLLAKADAERSSDGPPASGSSSSVSGMLNLNLGWSF